MKRTHRRYRRNARPNENEIPTVRIVRRPGTKTNPRRRAPKQPRNRSYAVQKVRDGVYRLYRRRADGAWDHQGDYRTAAAARRASEPTRDNPRRRVTKRRRTSVKRRRVARRRHSPAAAAGARLAQWRWHHNPTKSKKRGARRGKKRTMVRRKHRRSKSRRVVRRSVRRTKLPKPPKGKRAGSVFKRKGRWFRVAVVKVRKGRKTIRRRCVRKTTARAAKRARK